MTGYSLKYFYYNSYLRKIITPNAVDKSIITSAFIILGAVCAIVKSGEDTIVDIPKTECLMPNLTNRPSVEEKLYTLPNNEAIVSLNIT